MADAARREAWQHTAWLAAMIANANRDRKKHPRPFAPDEFNPMACPERGRRAGATVVTPETMSELKAAFVAKSDSRKTRPVIDDKLGQFGVEMQGRST